MPERLYDRSYPSFLAPLVGFKSRKAAQVCAYFALRADGIIDKLKLIKLVYFTERQMLAEHYRPMLFDEFFSLPHGPICSSTLNGIDGEIHEDIWDEFVAHNGNQIVSMKKFERGDFDELSDAEIDALEKTWNQFGAMTASQLRNYSHDHCPEYTEVVSGRIPISYREVMESIGIPPTDAESAEKEISEARREQGLLSA